MFEIIFKDRENGTVRHAITDVTMIRHVTRSEVGFVDRTGHIRSSSFTQLEDLEVKRIDLRSNPQRKEAT